MKALLAAGADAESKTTIVRSLFCTMSETSCQRLRRCCSRALRLSGPRADRVDCAPRSCGQGPHGHCRGAAGSWGGQGGAEGGRVAPARNGGLRGARRGAEGSSGARGGHGGGRPGVWMESARSLSGCTPCRSRCCRPLWCGVGAAGVARSHGSHAYNLQGGNRALIAAAQAGRGECVAALLVAGADAAVANIAGWTALHAASASGSADSVRALLERGAPLDAQTQARAPPQPAARCGAVCCANGCRPVHPSSTTFAACAYAAAAGRGDAASRGCGCRPSSVCHRPPGGRGCEGRC